MTYISLKLVQTDDKVTGLELTCAKSGVKTFKTSILVPIDREFNEKDYIKSTKDIYPDTTPQGYKEDDHINKWLCDSFGEKDLFLIRAAPVLKMKISHKYV